MARPRRKPSGSSGASKGAGGGADAEVSPAPSKRARTMKQPSVPPEDDARAKAAMALLTLDIDASMYEASGSHQTGRGDACADRKKRMEVMNKGAGHSRSKHRPMDELPKTPTASFDGEVRRQLGTTISSVSRLLSKCSLDPRAATCDKDPKVEVLLAVKVMVRTDGEDDEESYNAAKAKSGTAKRTKPRAIFNDEKQKKKRTTREIPLLFVILRNMDSVKSVFNTTKEYFKEVKELKEKNAEAAIGDLTRTEVYEMLGTDAL